MEYFKSLESRNFRMTFTSVSPDKIPPDPNDQVNVAVYGNSPDGMKFCASSNAMALIDAAKCKNPATIIRAYEQTLPLARGYGFLDAPDVKANAAARQTFISPSPAPSPAPAYVSNPFDRIPVSPATGPSATPTAVQGEPAQSPTQNRSSLQIPPYSPNGINPAKRPELQKRFSSSNKI